MASGTMAPASLPFRSFQSSFILAEHLVLTYDRYHMERLSLYHRICFSAGIPQEVLAFPLPSAQRWLWSQVTLCCDAFSISRTENLMSYSLVQTQPVLLPGQALSCPQSSPCPFHHRAALLISQEQCSTGFRD